MKPQRRDASRRITPDLLHFHIKRAHALREECYRDIGRAIATLGRERGTATFAVGRDGRLSSPELADALMDLSLIHI